MIPYSTQVGNGIFRDAQSTHTDSRHFIIVRRIANPLYQRFGPDSCTGANPEQREYMLIELFISLCHIKKTL